MMSQFDKPAFEFPLVIRAKWGAMIPKWRESMTVPLEYVRLTHTGTETCNNHEICCKNLQTIQRFYMDDIGLPDIPFNFMIGGNNLVYKGRGWFNEPARPPSLDWLKEKCLDVAFIGNYRATQPNDKLMNKAFDLIKYGVESGKISKSYKLIKMGENPKSPLDLEEK